jgi:hypothetical protein
LVFNLCFINFKIVERFIFSFQQVDLVQAETATFIKQAETAYLIAVNLSPLSSQN